MCRKPLLVYKALIIQFFDLRTDFSRFCSEAQTTAVDLNFLSGSTSQQLIHKNIKILSTQIPQCIVNGADGHHIMTCSAVAIPFVQLIPKHFYIKCIFAFQKISHLLDDRCDSFAVNGPVKTLQPSFGFDAYKILTCVSFYNFGIRLVFVFLRSLVIIDVNSLHLELSVVSRPALVWTCHLDDFHGINGGVPFIY